MLIMLRFTMSSLLLVRWNWRNYLQPSTGTFFHIRIVALRILAEIPIILLLRLRGRLDICRRLLLDDYGWFRIIWVVRIVVRRPPPRTPSTPFWPNPDTSPKMGTSTMMAPPIICKPGYGVCGEQNQNSKNNANGPFHFHLLLCGGFLVPSSTIKKILIPFLLLL